MAMSESSPTTRMVAGRPGVTCNTAGSLTANELVAIGNYFVAVVRFLNSPRTTPQNFSQQILKCTSLGRLNDIA